MARPKISMKPSIFSSDTQLLPPMQKQAAQGKKAAVDQRKEEAALPIRSKEEAVAEFQRARTAGPIRSKEEAIAEFQRARAAGFSDYGGEPDWMQRISNSTICNWFYTFYLANLIVFFLVIVASGYAYFYTKRHFTINNIFFALLQLIVAGTNMLFFYMMCDRSLKPSL